MSFQELKVENKSDFRVIQKNTNRWKIISRYLFKMEL